MRNQFRIQKVENDLDYQICLNIRRKVFIEEQGVPESREIDSMKGENFLLYIGDEAVATGRYVIEGNVAKYERIAVLEPYRGKGVGKRLMDAMEADQKKGYPDALSSTSAQVEMLKFYEKQGWIPIGPIYRDAGIDHRMMIKLPNEEIKQHMLADPTLPEELREALEKQT